MPVTYQAQKDHFSVTLANPIVGLYSPTDGSKGTTLRTTFVDRLGAILFGRQPVSALDDLVKDWRANGGDTIRSEYERAFQEFTTMTLVDTGRATMEAYIETLVARGDFADYFADEVTIDVVGSGQTAQGRVAVEGMIRYLHEQAFDAGAEVKSLIADDSRAALEADFVGHHTGEFAGIAPTGRHIRVPYSVHYDLDIGRIKALRVYGLASGLVHELSA